MSAQHYLYPFMVHRTDHRPEFSPHWRCMVLLRMHDGQEVFSLLDIWPPTFTHVPESLTVQQKTEVAGRLEGGDFRLRRTGTITGREVVARGTTATNCVR
jgi:hypothetical protein